MRARLIFEAFRYIVNSFYVSGQRRRVTETIKRELRRRLAVEPLGHTKGEHRMGRNYLPATHGLLEWLALLLSITLAALKTAAYSARAVQIPLRAFFTGD